jgi:hypothetical protein
MPLPLPPPSLSTFTIRQEQKGGATRNKEKGILL